MTILQLFVIEIANFSHKISECFNIYWKEKIYWKDYWKENNSFLSIILLLQLKLKELLVYLRFNFLFLYPPVKYWNFNQLFRNVLITLWGASAMNYTQPGLHLKTKKFEPVTSAASDGLERTSSFIYFSRNAIIAILSWKTNSIIAQSLSALLDLI